MGTHDELLKIKNGLYSVLWNRQERIKYLKKELEVDEGEEIIAHADQPHYSDADWMQKWTTNIPTNNLLSNAKEKLSESLSSQYRYRTFDNQSDADQSNNSIPETNDNKNDTTDNAYSKN